MDTGYILIVDDDNDMCKVTAAVLRLEGFVVACVSNGLDALEYVVKNGVPTLVIADLTMPVMDGRQFLAERRKWLYLTQVPFVVLTASMNVSAEELGVAEVVHKPVHIDRLIAVARRYTSLSSGLYAAVERPKTKTGA